MPAPPRGRRPAPPAESPRPRLWHGPTVVALCAGLVVCLGSDPNAIQPTLWEAPGITVDESFNVEQGVILAIGLRGFVLGENGLLEVYTPPLHLPDHPPLGRLWLGVFHQLTQAVFPSPNRATPFIIAAARSGSAAAFALTVLLVGWVTARWYGAAAGTLAALSLVLMPRVLGHAHLASLETVTGLAYAASVLGAAALWTRGDRPSTRAAVWTGAVYGLLLLTKVQAVQVPVPVALWALWHWRTRALVPLVAWGAAAGAVFFIGWPYLWLDPWDHVLEYFARSSDRSILHVWYLGERFVDREAPWHYPWVMFLATMPVLLVVAGAWGLVAGERTITLFRKNPRADAPGSPPDTRAGSGSSTGWQSLRSDRRLQLVLACLLFPLVLFSLPGIAVYDGVRLFLVSFPLWAVCSGRGLAPALARLEARVTGRYALGLLALLLFAQSYPLLALRPLLLSYYSVALGGLRGAASVGMEPTYWADSLTPGFIDEVARHVPRGSRVMLAPTLHQFQTDVLSQQLLPLQRAGLTLEAYSPGEARTGAYLLIYTRLADLSPELRQTLDNQEPLAAVRRDGVLLAGLYRLE